MADYQDFIYSKNVDEYLQGGTLRIEKGEFTYPIILRRKKGHYVSSEQQRSIANNLEMFIADYHLADWNKQKPRNEKYTVMIDMLEKSIKIMDNIIDCQFAYNEVVVRLQEVIEELKAKKDAENARRTVRAKTIDLLLCCILHYYKKKTNYPDYIPPTFI
jgi:hypothetical protein